MIHINLLAVERDRAPRRAALPSVNGVVVGAILILGATVVVIAWWFLSLRQHSARLDEQLAQAEAETRQVRSVLEKVQTFEARKALLQQRVSLIEQLRKGQGTPVHLLDEISKSLPERLWLTELTQGGAEVTMSGMTDSLTALSDFVANLEATQWFRKPVEIVDSHVQPDPGSGDLIRFQIKAQFVEPKAPAKPGARGAKGSS